MEYWYNKYGIINIYNESYLDLDQTLQLELLGIWKENIYGGKILNIIVFTRSFFCPILFFLVLFLLWIS